MTTTPAPVVILTKQAVHMGDHAQDVHQAIQCAPGETVEDLARRALTRPDWRGERHVEPEWYLTIRLPEPAPHPHPRGHTP